MRQIRLFYNKTYPDKNKNSEQDTNVEIEYLSRDKFDIDYCLNVRGEILKYLKNEYDSNRDDIIDIINKIRDITEGIIEKELKVSIKKENYEGNGIQYREWVSYKNGFFSSAGSNKRYWDDEIEVRANSQGINITYNEKHFGFNYEKIDYVKERLKPLYVKVMTLCSMTNEEEKYKETEQERVYQKKLK
ncbi:MAG: hypothetical protein VZS44_03315 [Bacilli bacterium]|nr:hypothetical protein [Bacilli bacterium]